MTIAWRPVQRSALAGRYWAELYESPPQATRALIASGELGKYARSVIWEPAGGKGSILRVLKAAGFRVHATDLIAYDGADPGIETPVDFLKERRPPPGVSVVLTNPPYKNADAFIRHGLELGLPVIVLLRWQSAEGEGRSDIIDRHLRRVWLGKQRLPMMHRQDWQGPRQAAGGAPFGWFCFEPGARNSPFEVTRIAWRESALDPRFPALCGQRRDDDPGRGDEPRPDL